MKLCLGCSDPIRWYHRKTTDSCWHSRCLSTFHHGHSCGWGAAEKLAKRHNQRLPSDLYADECRGYQGVEVSQLEKEYRIHRGHIAVCSLGALGLITEDGMHWVTYSDGNRALAYIGVHLTDKVAPIGSPWSSRNPKVVEHITSLKIHKLLEL